MLVSTAKGGRVAVGWAPGEWVELAWDEDMVVGGFGWVRRQVSKAVAYSRTRGSQLVSFPSHSSYAITSPHEELLNKMRTERAGRLLGAPGYQSDEKAVIYL